MKKLCLSFFVASCLPLFAADHLNLEEGLPTELEDAYPVAFRGREIQAVARYQQMDDGKDQMLLEPRIEFGFAPNAQARISAPFLLGNADKTDSGNVGLELFYNFNTEGVILPAFALAGRADFPSGREAAGIDTTVKAIATKSITKMGLDRIHVNGAWIHNAGNHSIHREDRYKLVFGYSRRIGPDTVLVADYVREQEKERGKTADILEIGARHQLTPLTVLSAGAGAGISKHSPEFRFTFGFQKSF